MKYKPFLLLECCNEKTATKTANQGEKKIISVMLNVQSNVNQYLLKMFGYQLL